MAKAQFGLAMLHIQERLFGDMTFSLPKLDGIFLAVDPNSEDERFLQLETTWYIYATEVYRVVPTVFDMLNQLQEDPELLPREIKKRAIYDFCTVYHPIRGLGYSMSSRVPPSLLHYYFSSIVTRINHRDRLIRV